MDRSEATTTSVEPTYLDALLLMALDYAERTHLRDAYALIDVLEHMIIEPTEWEHACDVLGRRGLIAPGDPCPKMTESGRSLLMHYSTRLSRPVAHMIAEELTGLEPLHARVDPPTREAQLRAIADYQTSIGSDGQTLAAEPS